MTVTLVFEHNGWAVATSAWTAAAKGVKSTEICYVWSPLPSMGILASSTGVERFTFGIPFEDFLDRVKQGGVVDFRQPWRRKP